MKLLNHLLTVGFFVLGVMAHLRGNSAQGTAYLAFSTAIFAHIRIDEGD